MPHAIIYSLIICITNQIIRWLLFGSWSASKGSAIMESLSSTWVSGLSTGLFATGWKPAVSRGLGNKEVAVALKAAALGVSILPGVVVVSVA